MAQSLALDSSVENVDYQRVIELNAGRLDTADLSVGSVSGAVSTEPGKRLYLVQFVGPVKAEWRSALEKHAVTVVAYVPQNAYLVYGPGNTLNRLSTWAAATDYVQWQGEYVDTYKVHPRARLTDAAGQPRVPETDLFAVQLVEDPEANAATLGLIHQWKLAPVRRDSCLLGYRNLLVRLPPERVSDLARQPELVSIQPYWEPKKLDERQDQILAGNLAGGEPVGPGYLAWLASRGFTQAQFAASGFVVDVSDSGIDNGTTSPGHFGLYPLGLWSSVSRVRYNQLEGTPNSGSTVAGCDGHGTLNAHIVAGFSDQPPGFPHTDAAGFRYGLGVCPFVDVGCSVIFDPDYFTYPTYPDLQSRAYNRGARISSNSWGQSGVGTGDYDVDAQTFDALVRDAQPAGAAIAVPGHQPMVTVFAAGNDGESLQTVGSPGTAKNVITVGASENVRSLSIINGGNSASGKDGCSPSASDRDADNANDIASFSSRGPCRDGRHKPDLVAPGSHITGGVGQEGTPSAAGSGHGLACFTGAGVCALAGSGTPGSQYNFFPLGQQFYTVSSGTSHSTPAVAGACALLRQSFINRGWTPPSPALTKAWLMNSARYLGGSGAGDSLWSESQGMGGVDLGMALDDTPRVWRDQLGEDKLIATGQTRAYTGTVIDSSKPFRVTLAWTDAPGNTTGNAYNNDLDLTVTVGGVTYKGNVFSGPYSTTGGAADAKNNVESVLLPAGTYGDFEVTVSAANINSDGVPGEDPPLDQDFALVLYNAGSGLAATFTAAPATGGVPLKVAFADHSIGEITNRFWDFGDGRTTNTAATNFSVTYTTTGTNPVTLIVSGPLGMSALTRAACVIVTNRMPRLAASGYALVEESCPNLAIDPGETVTVSFRLQNIGGADTTNLVATLVGGNGVVSPSLPQTYGMVPVGGTAVGRPFQFIAEGGCGETIAATLQLQDGTADLGTVSFALPLGKITVFAENFDDSVTGEWPVGWATAGTGAQGVWMITNTAADSLPFSAFSIDASGVGVNEMVSPAITLPDGVLELSFRQDYALEAGSGNTAYDGGVLEMKIDAGEYEDILAAGGRFVSGGYNRTLSLSYGNPLAGRQVWSGDSGGFTSTVVSLPAGASGRSVQFRWRCATDEDSGAGGWYVDTVLVTSTACCAAAPVLSNQVQNLVVVEGGSLALTACATGTYPLYFQWRLNGQDIPGATGSSYAGSAVRREDAGIYSILVTNSVGAATGQVAVVQIVEQPRLLSPQVDTNGSFSFLLSGTAGFDYVIEGTTNWSHWEPLETLSNLSGLAPFTDTNAASLLLRAYRARLSP